MPADRPPVDLALTPADEHAWRMAKPPGKGSGSNAPRPPAGPQPNGTPRASEDLGPKDSSEARARFKDRTGIDPFADDRIGTAYLYAALAEAMTVMRGLEAWATPIADALPHVDTAPDFAKWVRYVAWAKEADPNSPGRLPCAVGASASSPAEEIDMLALHDDIVALIERLASKTALLSRVVRGLQKDRPIDEKSAEVGHFLDQRKVGRQPLAGKAKFVQRLQGVWASSGRPPLEAQDVALLAIAVGLEPARPDDDDDDDDDNCWWPTTIARWRDYSRANPPSIPDEPRPRTGQ